MERITARDGAQLVLHSTGAGPGIVLVHGGGITIDTYRRLAAALAPRFTVHLYNRRGRGDAPPRTEPYSYEQDVDDLAVVLEHTGAGNVIGHSSGGFIALRAALKLPIDRLAVYDAAVSIDGGFPSAWLEPARAAARAGDIPRALALTAGGINTQMATAKLPLGVQIAIIKVFMRTPIGRMMADLLPMTLDESATIRRPRRAGRLYAGDHRRGAAGLRRRRAVVLRRARRGVGAGDSQRAHAGDPAQRARRHQPGASSLRRADRRLLRRTGRPVDRLTLNM